MDATQFTEAERERCRKAAEAMAPLFAQMQKAMIAYVRAAAPALAQLARALEGFRQDEYALAPPRPGEPRRRGPGRRGREAQRSPYGPQGRR